jgi:hypothetical protein
MPFPIPTKTTTAQPCPKLFTGIEEHCLGEVYKGRSRLSKCNGKLIMDLIWFKVEKQPKRERVCIA